MPVSDYTPSTAEIGTRIAARTYDLNGKRHGTFTTETRPTASEVSELIEDATAAVSAAVGANIDNEYWKMAKTAVICYVCMSIEIGYYPESSDAGDSAYQAYKQRYEALIMAIDTAISQRRPNERRIVSLSMTSLTGIRGGRLDPWSNFTFP